MRVPSMERFAHLAQIAGIFLCGLVVGCALFNSVFHLQMEKVLKSNREYKEQIEELQDEAKVSETYKNKQVISKIMVRIEKNPADNEVKQIAQEQIKNSLQKELSILKGNSIYDIDRDAKIARLLLNKKRYTVDGNDYTIAVKTMLLVDKVLHIWISVDRHIRN
ncbi:hypothetical protein SY83_21625 [Paenibacillus swuensis]|uniref:Sporulation membrane protein YtrI C-terminal domain-containing protein n=1 Tax=Paenibacillus swuensis TaxID=1178515 RepID=A0A172TN48_9BACL|nr:hypothetical protein [Paenibacillus swuensis]ANE48450.1 hypothetical protein SY83_21625 [Paenibacillus swuensis]